MTTLTAPSAGLAIAWPRWVPAVWTGFVLGALLLDVVPLAVWSAVVSLAAVVSGRWPFSGGGDDLGRVFEVDQPGHEPRREFCDAGHSRRAGSAETVALACARLPRRTVPSVDDDMGQRLRAVCALRVQDLSRWCAAQRTGVERDGSR